MKIKIKRLHPDAVVPSYAKPGDAGMDLTAVSKVYDKDGNVSYGTGLAFEIPEGYVGLLFPRSSNSKKDLLLSNSVGVLDSGYRGEVSFKFKPAAFFGGNLETVGIDSETYEETFLSPTDLTEYSVGERIGQIIILPYPQITFQEVEELSTTERGEGGFGSTGK
ncbi:MAG: dUTP diphosphatase [Cytophagia bacterium]|nr:dUTP diphosphatase [Cytophagia bacterium]